MNQPTNPTPTDQFCSLSQRVDGKLHSWKFDGDDPYIICFYCDQMRDSLTGRIIRPGRGTPETLPNGQSSKLAGDTDVQP